MKKHDPALGWAMYKLWYGIRILGAVLMLCVAGLLMLTLLGVDVGLFKR